MGMIEEQARLDRSLDVDTMSFDEVMALLRAYVKRVLLTDEATKKLGIGPSLQARLQDLVESAEQRSDPDPARCEADRVAAWNLQMSLPKASSESLAAEVVVLCTYDRASAEFDTYGPDAMIESIMTSVCRLGDAFCSGFVDFAVSGTWRTG